MLQCAGQRSGGQRSEVTRVRYCPPSDLTAATPSVKQNTCLNQRPLCSNDSPSRWDSLLSFIRYKIHNVNEKINISTSVTSETVIMRFQVQLTIVLTDASICNLLRWHELVQHNRHVSNTIHISPEESIISFHCIVQQAAAQQLLC